LGFRVRVRVWSRRLCLGQRRRGGARRDQTEAAARVGLPELVRLVAVAVGAQQCVQCGEALHAAEHAARALAQQRRHLDPRRVVCGAPLLLRAVLGLVRVRAQAGARVGDGVRGWGWGMG
jgi:hypothetical protein